MNGMGYVASLIQDREVFYRERQSGAYRVSPYFLHKVDWAKKCHVIR